MRSRIGRANDEKAAVPTRTEEEEDEDGVQASVRVARADDGRAQRENRCREAGWFLGGGGVYLIIHPHTRTSLHLDNDKNSGVVEPPQKWEG